MKYVYREWSLVTVYEECGEWRIVQSLENGAWSMEAGV